MQAQGRRKVSASNEAEARQNDATNDASGRSTSTPRGGNSARSQSANRRANALNNGDGSAPSARSGSQPKQRANNGRSASTGKNTEKPIVPTQSPYEIALAKMKKAAAGKSEDHLEMLLQQLLQQRQFEDAAYLIASSSALEAKYKTSDVIRLLLDIKQFDKAAQLIRDMKLQSNQLLVTLFIKELVRASLFQQAVRYAQEMVQNFGKSDFGPRDQSRPSWTPQALIQAMIRAQQFRSALKYAKQFELLEMFPPAQLIASMFEVRSWDEGVSSVLEFRLFKEFPLELLVQQLLQHRQWSNAVKCINKLPTKEVVEKAYEALVREAARVGDFVTSLRYLREFKLDQPDVNGPLLKYFVDCMIAHGELYKAIKYSIKFGMNAPPPDAEETGEQSVYDTELLIRKAIECGQYHVALTYIKKLKLKDQFAKELVWIEQQQERMLHEFHQFIATRRMQYQHPDVQGEMAAILGTQARDEKVDQTIEADIVLSVEEEIIPRKPKPVPQDVSQASVSTTDVVTDSLVGVAPTEILLEAPRRSSRFSFARAEDSPTPTPLQPSAPHSAPLSQQQPQSMHQQQSIPRAPPPGLAVSAPPAAPSALPSAPSSASTPSSSFNFAQFAANLQSGPGNMPTPPQSQPQPHLQPPQGLTHLFPHQSPQQPNAPRPNGFYPPPPPPQQFNGMQAQHVYGVPPPPHQQQQQQVPPPVPNGMFFQHPQPGFVHPQQSNSMPPPPMPPHYVGSNGTNPSGNFDVSSLAMQFHARPQGPSFGNSFGPPGAPSQFGQGGPPPPPMPPGMPGGLFPSMGPPPMQAYPPQQPQFSFKPSVSYTSVTTTRQKKP